MTVEERIKARRIELGMTQSELARRCGYSDRSSIKNIEINAQKLPMSKLEVVAKALNVNPSYLLGWEIEKPVYNTHLAEIVDSQLSNIALTDAQIDQLMEYARFLAKDNR